MLQDAEEVVVEEALLLGRVDVGRHGADEGDERLLDDVVGRDGGKCTARKARMDGS